MKARTRLIGTVVVGTICMGIGIWFFIPRIAGSHCDTLAGPVVMIAKTALEKGDVTPVLKWVKREHEGEIREIFKNTLAVRKLSPEARKLVDMYFFETLVRIHRAGEGAPYTGLKPGEAVEPIIAEADQALEKGAVDDLVKHVTDAVAKGIRERFNHVKETKKNMDKSVEAGREFVEAYVVFTHYVEGIHEAAQKAAHGHQPEHKEGEAHTH
ncbi:MAG: DUF6448 family protein [Thermodesulfobacteriota bacterium]